MHQRIFVQLRTERQVKRPLAVRRPTRMKRLSKDTLDFRSETAQVWNNDADLGLWISFELKPSPRCRGLNFFCCVAKFPALRFRRGTGHLNLTQLAGDLEEFDLLRSQVIEPSPIERWPSRYCAGSRQLPNKVANARPFHPVVRMAALCECARPSRKSRPIVARFESSVHGKSVRLDSL